MKQLADTLEPGPEDAEEAAAGRRLGVLALTALGVVYGDIGTSPLYAVRACFAPRHGLAPTDANVLGVLSLIVWSLIVVVSVKYLLYVLRADNRGEGGILALMALLSPAGDVRPRLARRLLIAVGVFGAALLYADGTITPAISVLSAVEGLDIATHRFDPWILPISVGILLGLFLFQRRGTAVVGSVFGPVMLAWFAVIAGLGARGVVSHPGVVAALDPRHALGFFERNGGTGFGVLGAVFLVATGSEALYADLGHFGSRPIRVSWFALVLPALLLNYLGQGALLIDQPAASRNPFYLLAPAWALYPLVGLATTATVIASQAVISGAFSLTRQAIQLGYSPRMRIEHTSSQTIGQVYIPAIDGVLMVATIALVLVFQRSPNLASVYGVAVSTTMVITTVLAYAVAVECWHWSRWVAAAAAAFFLCFDLSFFGSNLLKLADGGWVPIAMALAAYALMSTWYAGKREIRAHFRVESMPLEAFVEKLRQDPPQRVPGTAVFVTGALRGTPRALLHQLEHNHVLHEQVVLLTIVTAPVPRVPARERVEIERLPLGFARIVARYGFQQTPRVPAVLRLAQEQGLRVDADSASFFLGQQIAIPAERGMWIWRARLYALMARNALRTSTFFHIPHERVIEIGVEVEL
jgi:KUP system potassium uptake protein